LEKRIHKDSLTERELDDLLNRLVSLRRQCDDTNTNSKLVQQELREVQEECAKSLDYLVDARTRRYKNFPNYDDLKQDGRLALCLALKSYNPEKGNIFWWANKYIKTKISREANRHSTLKIPIPHTKTVQPYKVSQLPIIVDNNLSAFEKIMIQQYESMVRTALLRLPNEQRQVIELHYEINNRNRRDSNSIGTICEKLNITKSTCTKLLREAKKNLKTELNSLGV